MKNISLNQVFGVIDLLLLLVFLFGDIGGKYDTFFLFYALVAIILLGFNIAIREKPSFKNYFMSKYNVFTSKYRKSELVDIPIDLLFYKIVEVVDNSKFHLEKADKNTMEIMATTRASISSMGENIYISFEKRGSKTMMNFCSATIVQIFSWGKNKKNHKELLKQIEESLII